MNAAGKIVFTCPACHYRARIPEHYMGMSIRCPGCSKPQVVLQSADAHVSTGRTVSITRVATTPLPFSLEEAGAPMGTTALPEGPTASEPAAVAQPASAARLRTPPAGSLGSAVPNLIFVCTACAFRARIPGSYAGKTILCPKCSISQIAPEFSPLVGGVPKATSLTPMASPVIQDVATSPTLVALPAVKGPEPTPLPEPELAVAAPGALESDAPLAAQDDEPVAEVVEPPDIPAPAPKSAAVANADDAQKPISNKSAVVKRRTSNPQKTAPAPTPVEDYPPPPAPVATQGLPKVMLGMMALVMLVVVGLGVMVFKMQGDLKLLDRELTTAKRTVETTQQELKAATTAAAAAAIAAEAKLAAAQKDADDARAQAAAAAASMAALSASVAAATELAPSSSAASPGAP